MKVFWGKAKRGRSMVAVACGLAVAGLAACGDDTPTEANTSAAVSDSDASAVLSDMTGDLGLTDEQKSALAAIAEEYSDRVGEPGVTWYLAADIQDVLTSEQIATLSERRDELRERAAEQLSGAGMARRGQAGSGFRRGMKDGAGGPRGIGGGPWTELDLTDAQIDAIQQILEEYRPQLEALRDQARDGTLSREEAREQSTAIRDAIRTDIEALLTPEQLAALDDLREARAERRADRSEAREQAFDAMVDALALTAEQQSQIEALRDAPLTEGTREERREAHREAFEAILTATQLEIVTIHEALRGHSLLRRISGGTGLEGGRGIGPGAHGGFGGGFNGGT